MAFSRQHLSALDLRVVGIEVSAAAAECQGEI